MGDSGALRLGFASRFRCFGVCAHAGCADAVALRVGADARCAQPSARAGGVDGGSGKLASVFDGRCIDVRWLPHDGRSDITYASYALAALPRVAHTAPPSLYLQRATISSNRKAASSLGLANFPKPPSFPQLEDARLEAGSRWRLRLILTQHRKEPRMRGERGLRPLPPACRAYE